MRTKKLWDPAFPQQGGLDQLNSMEPVQGMSLRDYFAAKVAANYFVTPVISLEKLDADDIARNAYRMADAMLRAREA